MKELFAVKLKLKLKFKLFNEKKTQTETMSDTQTERPEIKIGPKKKYETTQQQIRSYQNKCRKNESD